MSAPIIPVLSADSYRGTSSNLLDMGRSAQPVFIGRVIWPGDPTPIEAIVKPYEIDTCGVANDAIGYIANAALGISQPRRAAILLLSEKQLAGLGIPSEKFFDARSGVCACWVTTYEQGANPFKYIRRASTFSERQLKAFYKSTFCRKLASVDHATGNNDRHEGNFLFIDDLHYLAIDQGCVAGGLLWHRFSPDPNPRNEIRILAQTECNASEWALWVSETLIEHERTQAAWPAISLMLAGIVAGLLEAEDFETIVEYIEGRVTGPKLAESLGRLI